MDKECLHNISSIVLIILFSVAVGYITGYHRGVKDMLDQYESYKEMFDRHTNEQWDMIDRRDSLYLERLSRQ